MDAISTWELLQEKVKILLFDHLFFGFTAVIVANKVITVGTTSRAEIIASFFDETPAPIRVSSSRGFLTITGYYQGTRISVVAIGMVDFFAPPPPPLSHKKH